MKKNKKMAIIFNILIIIFEIIGITIYVANNKGFDFSYYTHDSNILALISSSIYLIYLLSNKEVSKLVSILRYTSTVALSITFIVVLFVLIPMNNFNFSELLFRKAMPYFHIICPLLSFISYIFFEKHYLSGIKDIIRGYYYTIVYTLTLIILNMLTIVDGPYPFLRVKNNTFIYSLFYFIVISIASISLGIIINRLNNKYTAKYE